MGKVVRFDILYSVTPQGSKTLEFGRIALSPTGPYLPDLAVEKGWVKVRENAGQNEQSEEATSLLEKLRALETKAKSRGEGLWQSSSETVKTTYDVSDPQGFLAQWKGQNINGKALAVRLVTYTIAYR